MLQNQTTLIFFAKIHHKASKPFILFIFTRIYGTTKIFRNQPRTEFPYLFLQFRYKFISNQAIRQSGNQASKTYLAESGKHSEFNASDGLQFHKPC
ncbi:MAG: hypothetical protein DWH82_00300 [Planctomycetota bacterium]|nr:MAG: hypothetical protein DWH82_00300 [Planctomycetota bacterium]